MYAGSTLPVGKSFTSPAWGDGKDRENAPYPNCFNVAEIFLARRFYQSRYSKAVAGYILTNEL
jgi:hypothetical protein